VSAAAVTVEGLGKRYRLGGARKAFSYRTLRESLTDLARLRRRDDGGAAKAFWALKDLSFTVKPGEVLGIIGRNGAGKSTLLKILSRITDPTEGQAEVFGRVGSLLEVGTGFHPELTGRENVFLNGAILGMRRADILRRFDEIVAFAEIGEFLDTPVKHYSSGMYMRLAFAVAAHLEPETLVIDEVLAVGDAAFQKKCLGKMGDVARHGRTVLFVSHNMGAVRALCTRCLVLHGGTLRFDGSPNEAVAYYMANIAGAVDENDGSVSWPTDPPEVNELRLRAVRLVDATGRPQSTHESGDPVRVEVDYEVKLPLRGSRMSVFVSTQEGEVAFVSTDHLATMDEQAPGLYRSTCTIPGKLLNRRAYVVGVSWDIPSQRIVFDRRDFLSFVVTGSGNQGSNFPEAWPGVVCPRLDWTVERL